MNMYSSVVDFYWVGVAEPEVELDMKNIVSAHHKACITEWRPKYLKAENLTNADYENVFYKEN
jgi:hypothetical protein